MTFAETYMVCRVDLAAAVIGKGRLMEAPEGKKRNVENKPMLTLTCTLRSAGSAVKTLDRLEPLPEEGSLQREMSRYPPASWPDCRNLTDWSSMPIPGTSGLAYNSAGNRPHQTRL